MSRPLPRDPVTGRFLPRGSEPAADLPLEGRHGEERLREVDHRATGWRRWLLPRPGPQHRDRRES